MTDRIKSLIARLDADAAARFSAWCQNRQGTGAEQQAVIAAANACNAAAGRAVNEYKATCDTIQDPAHYAMLARTPEGEEGAGRKADHLKTEWEKSTAAAWHAGYVAEYEAQCAYLLNLIPA